MHKYSVCAHDCFVTQLSGLSANGRFESLPSEALRDRPAQAHYGSWDDAKLLETSRPARESALGSQNFSGGHSLSTLSNIATH